MNPQYQQAMIQALMGSSYLPSYMTGQNPTTPYGQGFLTGQMVRPNNPLTSPNNYGMNTMGTSNTLSTNPIYASSGLSSNPTTQLMQPTSTMTM